MRTHADKVLDATAKKSTGKRMLMILQKVWSLFSASFRRKPESSRFSVLWMRDQVQHNEFGVLTIFPKLGCDSR